MEAERITVKQYLPTITIEVAARANRKKIPARSKKTLRLCYLETQYIGISKDRQRARFRVLPHVPPADLYHYRVPDKAELLTDQGFYVTQIGKLSGDGQPKVACTKEGEDVIEIDWKELMGGILKEEFLEDF